MNEFMNSAEFANIALAEKDFWWYRGMRSILFRFLDPFLAGRSIRRALEAGCGTGYLSRLLQTERRLPVVPLDIGWEGLRRARAMGVRDPVRGNILTLPFPDGAFDLVLCVDVLPHVPRGDEERAAAEFARVLAPGGLLVVRAAAYDFLHSRHSQFVYERQRFTKHQLTSMAEKSGIRILRATYANSLLLPIAAAKFRLWEPLTRQAPTSGVAPVAPWLDRLLHGALAAEASWIGAGRNLPAGQTVLLVGEKAR